MFIYKRCKCNINPKDKHSISSPSSLSKLLKLVSVPSRLSILFLLDSGPHCVCDITAHTKMSQTLASHHLSDLMKAGLVESQKNGQFVDYNLAKKGRAAMSALEKLISI